MNLLDPIGWAIVLLVLGCGLLVLEVFIPSGGIFGFLATLAVIGSMVMGFRRDTTTGLSFMAIAVFAVPAVIALAFKYWPMTPMGKAVWVHFTLVPGLTDDPANVGSVAKFVAPMKNVEWVEVLPFHQLGSFKWKQLGLDYTLESTPAASTQLVARVLDQFRAAGCNAR